MAKKIKFPLIFENNLKARTLDELQQYADIENLVRYYHNEKLKIWLEARDYNDIVSQIISIDTTDASYVNTLCNILGIEYENLDIEVHEIQKNEEKLNRLRRLTSDENILANVENIVFNQQELDELVIQKPELIYLCADENQTYIINKEFKNIRYIGLFGKPSIQVEAENIKELFDIGIKFKDIVLPAYLQKGLRTEVEYKGANLDVDVNKINAEKLHKVVQANFIDFIYDSDCRTHKLKHSINSIIPVSTIDLFIRSNKLKAIVKNKLGEK